MKLSSICTLSVAGFAVHAAAAPIRAISFVASDGKAVKISSQPVLPFRIGLAGAPVAAFHSHEDAQFTHPIPHIPIDGEGARVAHINWAHDFGKELDDIVNGASVPAVRLDKMGKMRKGGCKGKGGLRSKFNEVANKFRKVMGMPELEPLHRFHHSVEGKEGRPMRVEMINSKYPDMRMEMVPEAFHGQEDNHFRHHMHLYGNATDAPERGWRGSFRQHGHHRFHHHRGGRSFSHRVMHALFILGPVEGRIVAFVLGLGIGALIRVVYVLCLVAYRSVKGRRQGTIALEESEDIVVFVAETVEEVREKAPAYTAVVQPGEATVTRSV